MSRKKNVGYKFYSSYFESDCQVTRYWTDKHWWFFCNRHEREFKAQSRLSVIKFSEEKRRKNAISKTYKKTLYRKKPVIIEAEKLTWDTFNSIMKWGDQYQKGVIYFGHIDSAKNEGNPAGQCLYIRTLEGEVVAKIGDYIIKGVQNEFYPCKPDIFKSTYERVKERRGG